MAALLPSHRPLQSREATERALRAAGVTEPVAVLAVRGYFLDTMGVQGRNDRGFYDDALIVVSPLCHVAFNGNTDPSIARKGIATLWPGLWRYKPGTHNLSKPKDKQYPAFVQAAAVTVARDGQGAPETGWFGINIHLGGYNSTSSLGCQTLPPAQWRAFRELLNDQLRRHGQKTFPYLLIHDPRMEATA